MLRLFFIFFRFFSGLLRKGLRRPVRRAAPRLCPARPFWLVRLTGLARLARLSNTPGPAALAALLLALLLPAASGLAASYLDEVPAESFDLPRVVERALRENFSLHAARANLDAAESASKATRGRFGPSLDTSYGFSRSEHSDDDLYTWRVYLTQNLFEGFATLSAYQKSLLQHESAEASLNRARLELILLVQQNFFMYLKAVADVRSAEQSLERLVEQLKVTTSFYNVGLRPRLDVLQAEVNVSDAEDVLLRARNSVETQRVRLNTLLNIPPQARTRYLGELDFIPFSLNLDQCLNMAFSKRPDLIIAAKTVEAARKDKTSAAANYYPKVDGEVGWSSRGKNWDVAGTKDRPTKYSEWDVGVTARLNLFESGRTYYNVQQSSHLISRAVAEEAELRQEVIFQVQSRLLDLDNAQQRIAVARKGLDQANEAYRVASARYKSQVGTSIDVLDAQARLTQAEVNLTGARADYLSALAALFSAVGEENPALTPR